MKKCPPGVLCVENVSIAFIILFVFIIGYLIYVNTGSKSVNPSEKIIIKETNRENIERPGWFSGWLPSWPYNNLPMFSDPLLNPYAPPLRDERYFAPVFAFNNNPGHYDPRYHERVPGVVPINVSTNVGAVDTHYRQLGILAPSNGSSKDNIIPLMGRPLFTNRDKWQYYTSGNQHNNIKLPVSKAGKSCTNEYGCDKLYNGDTVYIEGANEVYRVTMYDNDTIKYLPYV